MQRQERILIVDDNPTNIFILKEMLGDDYHLESATSGEEGLTSALAFRPDLILLDIMMPGINGYETCRRLRANSALHHTKIIMLSAKAMMSERLKGYEAGADDYIIKPFDGQELLAKVRVYLRLKSVEEVNQLKSDVLSLLSHETNTPLHKILLSANLLREYEDLEPEERQRCIENIEHSAQLLHRLFQKVMSLSAMKSGTWNVQLAQADLCEVVRKAMREVVSLAGERNVEIEAELPDITTTLLDTERMKAVVNTMLENAIRFSPLGGRVTVRVWSEGKYCCMTISDKGAGIDPDFLPRVFEEFAAADIIHHNEGQGLSLAIARQVVLAHNGTIEVESTKGDGATFTVRLPVAVSGE